MADEDVIIYPNTEDTVVVSSAPDIIEVGSPGLQGPRGLPGEITDAENAVEANAVVSKYRRGYNNSGSEIAPFKFLMGAVGFYLTYPRVKIVDNYDDFLLGLTLNALPQASGAKIIYYGVVKFLTGGVDTSVIPYRTPVYCDDSGNLTLDGTPFEVGYTLSQEENPYIFLHLPDRPVKYKEFTLSGDLEKNIVHNWRKIPSLRVLDNAGEDITSGINVKHSEDKKEILISSNVPLTGKVVCSI